MRLVHTILQPRITDLPQTSPIQIAQHNLLVCLLIIWIYIFQESLFKSTPMAIKEKGGSSGTAIELYILIEVI